MDTPDETPVDPILPEQPAEAPLQLRLGQPLQLELAGQPFKVIRTPEGPRIIIGPAPVLFVLPLDDESANLIARELTGGIQIATTLPPSLNGRQPL